MAVDECVLGEAPVAPVGDSTLLKFFYKRSRSARKKAESAIALEAKMEAGHDINVDELHKIQRKDELICAANEAVELYEDTKRMLAEETAQLHARISELKEECAIAMKREVDGVEEAVRMYLDAEEKCQTAEAKASKDREQAVSEATRRATREAEEGIRIAVTAALIAPLFDEDTTVGRAAVDEVLDEKDNRRKRLRTVADVAAICRLSTHLCIVQPEDSIAAHVDKRVALIQRIVSRTRDPAWPGSRLSCRAMREKLDGLLKSRLGAESLSDIVAKHTSSAIDDVTVQFGLLNSTELSKARPRVRHHGCRSYSQAAPPATKLSEPATDCSTEETKSERAMPKSVESSQHTLITVEASSSEVESTALPLREVQGDLAASNVAPEITEQRDATTATDRPEEEDPRQQRSRGESSGKGSRTAHLDDKIALKDETPRSQPHRDVARNQQAPRQRPENGPGAEQPVELPGYDAHWTEFGTRVPAAAPVPYPGGGIPFVAGLPPGFAPPQAAFPGAAPYLGMFPLHPVPPLGTMAAPQGPPSPRASHVVYGQPNGANRGGGRGVHSSGPPHAVGRSPHPYDGAEEHNMPDNAKSASSASGSSALEKAAQHRPAAGGFGSSMPSPAWAETSHNGAPLNSHEQQSNPWAAVPAATDDWAVSRPPGRNAADPRAHALPAAAPPPAVTSLALGAPAERPPTHMFGPPRGLHPMYSASSGPVLRTPTSQ